MLYDIRHIEMRYPNGMRGSLSNICLGNGRSGNTFATVQDLQDAVEDSENAEALVKNISTIKLAGMDGLKVDRDTAEYTRLKGSDPIGNVHYLIIAKRQKNG